MVDTIADIQPLASFREDPTAVLDKLKTGNRPIALTENGDPLVILQDPAEYQRMLDRLDAAESREGIRRGLDDIKAGRVRPAIEVFAELDEEYGLHG